MATSLLLIDPQNDFCSPDGTLFVSGAVEDCGRIASFIDNNNVYIDAVYITLDTHPTYHIAHPLFWKDKTGNPPPPFTQITYADYKAEKFVPVAEYAREKAARYLYELEARGRYNLIIWPLHCLQGSTGAAVDGTVLHAVHSWERMHPMVSASYITKASNPYTEHYSALQAEVPDPEDENTGLNKQLIAALQGFDRIIIAGEALSHCVANTVRDLMQYIPPQFMLLLKDCSSPVTGFEQAGADFLKETAVKGMRHILSTERLS